MDTSNPLTENEQWILTLEYSLRYAIDIAIRWKLEAIKFTVNKNYPFGLFTDFCRNARGQFDFFELALRRQLTNESINTGMYEKDIKRRFLPMIDDFKSWYALNKAQAEREFKNNNPYDFIDNVSDSVLQSIKTFFPKTLDKPTKNGANPQTLKEIFINEAAYTECIEALRNVKDPVISADNRYLLGSRQKGAFTAWYEVAKFKDKFKPQITLANVAQLLNKEITGLNLGQDGSTLRRTTTTMYKRYRSPFTKLIT